MVTGNPLGGLIIAGLAIVFYIKSITIKRALYDIGSVIEVKCFI